MVVVRQVSLFRNGRNQALRVPREFELPGNRALMRCEAGRLVIEPIRQQSLAEVLAAFDDLGVDFPPIEDQPIDLTESWSPITQMNLTAYQI